ncbi:hypothetical protein [Lactiplantibacillus plantarum]|uniref:hypothetical protein n=1 Tax=Lactiplantibacillus plantarum TaxID=1590 RepID=UPI0024466BAD|nr:hypothetical protein [Lactiplantibacillus plantarum]MDG6763114.1 hypothetical protein [Lactiplantibacillus plantarum]MDH2715332.1 hypothetical protein [Lactiplantibacillus plantarum]MDH7467205.1 hypothetical protein [Lactiplantibacillus plantarum]MDN3213956.1 hypothetical protein [Lactiplantibacillus plantarum]MDN3216759.1 hypothetical protein [Lactiplantibacillus plantarum]
MKVQIDSASRYDDDITKDYGEEIKQAGFDIEVEKADYDECHSFIANFDFSKLPDLVNAVKEDIIVHYPERDGVVDKDMLRLTIYDDYLE